MKDWKNQTLAERLNACRAMLRLHDLLSEAENAKVIHRQVKRGLLQPKETKVCKPK